MDFYTKMFINVVTIDGIKTEPFHCRNHSTSLSNIYYKFLSGNRYRRTNGGKSASKMNDFD